MKGLFSIYHLLIKAPLISLDHDISDTVIRRYFKHFAFTARFRKMTNFFKQLQLQIGISRMVFNLHSAITMRRRNTPCYNVQYNDINIIPTTEDAFTILHIVIMQWTPNGHRERSKIVLHDNNIFEWDTSRVPI